MISIAAGSLFNPRAADAACEVIPGVQMLFGGAEGSANQPFAAPGEIVELTPPVCTTQGGDFAENATGGDHVVTLAITAYPSTSTTELVTIQASCPSSKLSVCSGKTVTCIERGSGDSLALSISAAGDGSNRALLVQWPEENELPNPVGPARIAVRDLTTGTDGVECSLGDAPSVSYHSICKEIADGSEPPIVCIDRLIDPAESACAASPAEYAIFPTFVALPEALDFRESCFSGEVCDPIETEIRMAADENGNLLLPVDWTGVLQQTSSLPIPRLISGRVRAPFPINLASDVFVSSWTPSGRELPPVFEPAIADSAGDVFELFGTTDATASVLRLARRHGTCDGGENAGELCEFGGSAADCPAGTCMKSCVDDPATTCTEDADCIAPGDVCGSNYDPVLAVAAGVVGLQREVGSSGGSMRRRTSRAANSAAGFCQAEIDEVGCDETADCPAGIGEDLCVRWAMEANDLVDFAGALESDSARTFIVREGVNLVDLNGDGDTIDPIIVFRDRGTGLGQQLGVSATCSDDGEFDATAEGRAVTMVRRGGYRSPAVALDGDRMAFLQDEEKTDAAGSGFPSEQYCDLNGDLDGMDSVLRVFEIGNTAEGGAVSIAGLSSRAVDPAPVIDGQSIAFRGDLLFFRTIESGSAGFAKDTANAVPPPPAPQLPPFFGTPRDAAISGDGTSFAWISSHPSGVGSPYEDFTHVIFRQGLTGFLEILSYAGSGDPADDDAESPALNKDGSVRAFASGSTELLPGATTNTSRIFVHTTADRLEFIDAGRAPKLSDDGRYVAYLNGSRAIVHDRTLNQTHWQSDSLGLGLTAVMKEVAISGNGQFVALVEEARPGEGIFWDRVRVHDIATNTTMTATNNAEGEAGNGPASSVSISADGQRVAFQIEASNMDSAGVPGVFVTDTQTGTTQRASVIDATAIPMPPPTLNPVISADGRMVVFGTLESGILPPDRALNDTGGFGEWIRHDLETGQTRSIAWATYAITDPGGRPALTADGRTLLYPKHADLSLRGTGAFDPIYDIDGDDTSGTILEVVDFGALIPEVTPICVATAVAPFTGGAAFLRPENTGLAGICPGVGDLNTDGDTDDEVAYLWSAVGGPQNLGVAATRIVATDSMVAALVSEQGDGTDHDGDDLLESQVLMLRASDGSGGWWNSRRDTIEVAVAGNLAGFTSRVGGTNVVASANFGAGSPGVTVNMEGFAGTDLVLGERSICPNGAWVQPLAFRVPESGNDLNSDGDQSDEVLVVWDLESGALISSGQSARPCPEAACDPRFPHRVEGTSVRFITLETDEAGAGTNGGTDIDGDCRDNGLVVQVLDLCAALEGGGGGSLINAEPARLGTSTGNALVDPLVEIDESFVRSISAGRCVILDNTESPVVCTEDGNECDALGPRSICDVATATCVLRVPAGCVPPDPNEPGQSDRCPAETVCETGVCAPLTVPCTDNGDCTAVAPATCQSGICTTSTTTCDDDGDCAGTEACFGIEVDSSGIAVAGSGICGPSLKSCSEDAECATGTTCIAGACVSAPTVLCAGSDDCSGIQFCREGTSVTAVRPQIQDRDGDGVPDDTDNCPDLFDPWQESGDCDGDCIPNRCDDDPCPTPQPTPTPTPSPTPSPVCGNGTIESGEQCDDGAANGDGATCCDTDCSYKADGPASCDGEACTNDTCTAGVCETTCRTGEACSICGGTCSSASGCECIF